MSDVPSAAAKRATNSPAAMGARDDTWPQGCQQKKTVCEEQAARTGHGLGLLRFVAKEGEDGGVRRAKSSKKKADLSEQRVKERRLFHGHNVIRELPEQDVDADG
jgi:hypothetical protein